MKKYFVFTFLFFSISLGFIEVKAQGDLNYPEDASEEEKKKLKYAYVRFTDAIDLNAEPEDLNIESYKKVKNDFIYMINRAPKLRKNVYQRGSELYKALAHYEKDTKLKEVFQDSALTIYDLQAQYFGEKADLFNEKAYLAYYYMYNKPARFGQLHEMYKETWKLNGDKIYAQNLQFWFQIMAVMKSNNSSGYYSKYEADWQPDVVTPLFDEVIILAEKKIALENDESEEWIDARTSIEQSFRSLVPYTCQLVKEYMEPKYRKNPNDIELIKEMVKIMAIATQDSTEGSGECLKGDPLFLELAEKLFENEPTYERANFLRRAHTDPAKRVLYRDKALELATTGEQKAVIYLELAGEARKSGNYPQARSYYKLAAQNNAALTGRCYTAIGDLYLSSGASCGGSNPLEKSAFAIAAYNMYVKAGNAAKQARARQYYPTKEKIFQYPDSQGKTYTCPCWIGETVVLPSL